MSPPGDGGEDPPDRADETDTDAPPSDEQSPSPSGRDDGPAISGEDAEEHDDRIDTGGRPLANGHGSPEESVGTPPAKSNDSRSVGESEPAEETIGWQQFVYDVLSSAMAVLLVGAFLFAVSGIWPPMVAVESPSMSPHMQTGDLVFVMEEQRFPGPGAHGDTGVVTARTGRLTAVDYEKFQREGDVIVYKPDGDSGQTPIIHRAMFWVNESENWYDKADRQAIGRYSGCGESPDEKLPNCPAPHAGFITKGDANGVYDQAQGLSSPVKPAWVVGTAEVRIPKLGCVRLRTKHCTAGVLATPLENSTGSVAGNATREYP